MGGEPSVLILKPKQMTAAARKAFEKVGILVIEVDDPASVRFLRPHAEMDSTEMLRAALRAISRSGGSTAQYLAEEITKAVLAKEPKPDAHPHA